MNSTLYKNNGLHLMMIVKQISIIEEIYDDISKKNYGIHTTSGICLRAKEVFLR
jgi:hypothetical protein